MTYTGGKRTEIVEFVYGDQVMAYKSSRWPHGAELVVVQRDSWPYGNYKRSYDTVVGWESSYGNVKSLYG